MSRKITLAQARAMYPHRFTLEHVPEWARQPLAAGRYYAPQYASDAEWYARTIFPGEPGLHGNARHCNSSTPTWPLGQSLPAPYALGSSGQDATPLHGALAYCNARQVAGAANAEFWRRLAGSLRKALTLL